MDKNLANISDFKNLETKKILYSFATKKDGKDIIHELIMITTPIKNSLKFQVLLNKVLIATEDNLDVAIEAYNKL